MQSFKCDIDCIYLKAANVKKLTKPKSLMREKESGQGPRIYLL